MIEKQITVYETEDGKQFKNKEEAILHENFLKLNEEDIKKEINEFLSNIDNYDSWVKKDNFSEEETHYCSNIRKENNKIHLTIVENKDSCVELDEDFLIDFDKWNNYIDRITKKYNIEFKIPIWYWSK